MEDPRPKMQTALKEAMKNKDMARRNAIRSLNSAIKQVEIDERRELSAEDVVELLRKEAKRRRESIEEYQNAGRDDLVETEKFEVDLIDEFLPQQMSEDEIAAVIQEIIDEIGASSPKDMGKVMGPAMERLKGMADGKVVNQIVKDKLSQ